MTVIDLTLFAGVFVSAIFSRENRRGLLWLSMLIFTYLLSSTYWRAGLPNPELVAGLCDAFVCFSIFYLGREVWELWLWRIFQASLLVNVFYLATNLFHFSQIDHDTYSIALEILNWLAIIFIGTISALMSKGLTNGRAFDPWISVFGFVRPVYAKTRKH